MIPALHQGAAAPANSTAPAALKRVLRAAAVVALALNLATDTAQAEGQSRNDPQPVSSPDDSALQQRPYRIGMLLTFEDQGTFTTPFRDGLVENTAVLVRRVVGDPWQCEVAEGGPELRRFFDASASDPDVASLERVLHDRDKLLIVHIGWHAGRYALAAREYDVTTRHWGPIRRRNSAVRRLLDREVLELCLAVFSPLAEQAPGSDADRIALTVQGAALTTADPTVQLVAPGTVFGLFRVFHKAESTLVEPVDWTYLTVESAAGGTVQCRLLSAYRSPTTHRAPGSRLLALGMRPVDAATRLRFLGRDGHSLAGYEVRVTDARSGAAPRSLTTDLQGSLIVPAADTLVSVALESGSQTLARLWVLPGAIAGDKEVVIPDDPVRFEVENRLAALQDAIIDEVARRTLAIRRVQALMDRDQWEPAKRLVDRLSSSNEPFRSRLNQTHADALRAAKERGSDSLPPKVQEMIDQTGRYIEVLLDPKHVDNLRAEFESRFRAAQANTSQ